MITKGQYDALLKNVAVSVDERRLRERREKLQDVLLQVRCLETLGKEVSLELIIELQTLYNRVYGK